MTICVNKNTKINININNKNNNLKTKTLNTTTTMPTTKNKRTKNPHICVPASQSRSPVDSRAASGKAGAASALSVSPSRTGEAYGNRPPGAS